MLINLALIIKFYYDTLQFFQDDCTIDNTYIITILHYTYGYYINTIYIIYIIYNTIYIILYYIY